MALIQLLATQGDQIAMRGKLIRTEGSFNLRAFMVNLLAMWKMKRIRCVLKMNLMGNIYTNIQLPLAMAITFVFGRCM